MTLETNHAIVIAALSDWLKNLASFSSYEKQNKNQTHLVRATFSRFEQATGNSARNSLVHLAVCSCFDLKLAFQKSFDNRSTLQ